MTVGEGMVELLFALLVQIGFAIALRTWAVWVARRHGGDRRWRRAVHLPMAGFFVTAIGLPVSVVLIMRAGDAAETVAPSEKATVMAERISTAMNATAIFVALAAVLYLTSFVVSVIGTLRAPAESDPQRGRQARTDE